MLANDSDPNGDPLQAILVQTTTHGALTLNSNGHFVYTPDELGWSGTDSFTYKASDGVVQSGAVNVTLTVGKPFGARENGDDETMAPVDSYGAFGASWLTGDLQTGIGIALGASLLYRGLSLSDPIIAVESTVDGNAPVADAVEVRLTLGGAVKAPVWYTGPNVGGVPAKARIALQIDDSSLATGRHDWEMTVISHFGSNTSTQFFDGTANVVRPDDGGGFGPGWMLAGSTGL